MSPLLSKLKKNCLDTCGQSTVEFAFIIPVLFIFFYAVLEFSHLFIEQQRVSALSRETTNAVFRDCSSQNPANLNACIQPILDELRDKATNILPGFDSSGNLIVSLYVPDTVAGGDPPPVKSLTPPKKTGGGNAVTRYTAGDLDPRIVSDLGVVVIGEAFYPYSPLTPIKQLISLLSLPGVLYENTIY